MKETEWVRAFDGHDVINLCKVIFKTKNRTNKTTNTPLALFKAAERDHVCVSE